MSTNAKKARKIISKMETPALRRILSNNAMLEEVRLAVGPKTNPRWVIGEVIECLYDRGAIDEEEMSRLRRAAGI